MHRPSLLLVARWALFGVTLLAAAAIRKGPSSAIDQAVIWLPTGVAIAGLCLLGLRAWWVVALTTVVQRSLLHYEWGMIAPAAVGSTAEAVLGVVVLRRWASARRSRACGTWGRCSRPPPSHRSAASCSRGSGDRTRGPIATRRSTRAGTAGGG